MTVYLVTGKNAYRDTPPGETFETWLDEGSEERAIRRGDIRVLERGHVGLRPGSFSLPSGWRLQSEGD